MLAEFDVMPNGDAKRLVEDPLLNSILDNMEAAAIERCVNAPLSDNETRQITAQEVRAIRSLRTQLKTLSEGKAKRKPRGSVV